MTEPHSSDLIEAVGVNEEAFEHVDEKLYIRFGAIARYFLAMARGEGPDDYDAELAGLPKIGASNDA